MLLLDRRASLWAYFLIHSCRFLRSEGRLAFVLPEAVVHVDYARQLLRELARRFKRLEWISIRERCFLGSGADERVGVLLAEGWGIKGDAVVYLDECQSVATLNGRLNRIDLTQSKSRIGRLNGHAVPQLIGNAAPKIARYLTKGTISLGDVARVKIGIVTGANSFFVLSEESRVARSLRYDALIPILAKFPAEHGLALDDADWIAQCDSGLPVWMLNVREKEKRKTVLQYLARFSARKQKQNRTFAKRADWRRPTMGAAPDAFLRCMGDVAPRLLLNRIGINSTNTIHRIYFNREITAPKKKLVALSLLSTLSQLSAEFEGRSYGSGVLKLEPSEAQRIRLRMPDRVNANEIASTYAKVDALLRQGRGLDAIEMVDKWLVHYEPNSSASVSKADLQDCLDETRRRRNALVLR